MDTPPPQPAAPAPMTPPPVSSFTPPPLPSGPSPFGHSGGNSSMLTFTMLGVLGFGALIFAVMTIVFYNKASVATRTLEQQKAATAVKAKAEQKKADDETSAIANESPFRSYVAPVEDGSFEVKFPKNWSGYVDQEKTSTQVNLILNPDFVRRTNSDDELAATRVQLIERSKDQYMQAFTSYVKRGTLKQADITVSGQHGFDLTGQFQDKKTSREVVVPVRDKVLIFINENSKYSTEFNQILAQSRIIP